jgi:hypothetical protein
MKPIVIFLGGVVTGGIIVGLVCYAQRHNGKPAFVPNGTPAVQPDKPKASTDNKS